MKSKIYQISFSERVSSIMHGTKLVFMRDFLSEAKMSLRQNEVNLMEVLCYQQILVKNLHEEAMKDELLVK